MLNFTVGPVQSEPLIREIGYEQVPYFRTPEFSEVMFENERLMKQFAKAEEGARAVFITGSGTASMEAAVINVFDQSDRVLVVNGGTFGQRFAEICRIHRIPHEEIVLTPGEALTQEMLSPYENAGITGFLVNLCETSTGVLYDIRLIGEFCRRNHAFLIVDAISAFMADRFSMQESHADIMITGSQKALACPPGISVLVLSENACKRISERDAHCLYLNLKIALKDGERGQTPFTPAVGILRQINARLKSIAASGGIEAENERIGALAADFRERIRSMPFEILTSSLSNAVTPLCPLTNTPEQIIRVLKDEYHIWVCPNGGELSKKVFRVGHIGALTVSDNQTLINALCDMQQRGIL